MPWRQQLQNEHEARRNDGLWRNRSIVESNQGRELVVSGKTYLNFCSNDYLGLAADPRLKKAAIDAVESNGTGSGASHLVCGHSDLHHRLESEVAQFVGAESAIIFSTGYMANLAIPQTFLGRNDLVLEDRLNHASLIDAGRNCEAKLKRYPHCSVEDVEKHLAASAAPRKMVLTDGVFSMDGSVAPIRALRTVCEKHDAMLVVDDAHGFGVLGQNGVGALEQAGILPTKNTLMVGTFGKSAGSFGAFVAGDAVYIESFVQHARTYIYTTALPPSVVAATSEAIKLFQSEPERRDRLNKNILQFRTLVSKTGLQLLDSQTAIQPIVFGSAAAAVAASQFLKEQGIWVVAIRPPTVPAGTSRLRITLTSEHTGTDIERLVSLLGSETIQRIVESDQTSEASP
jgi:8-amino-7-oxononanoate synthase